MCDYGSPAPQNDCLAAVEFVAALAGETPKRNIQVGNGGACNEVGWGSVPLGCSAQTGGDWTAHYKTSGVNCNTGYQLLCSDPNPILVHKVRVQLLGANHLHMREVQVFDSTSGVNRALNKPATQSSTSDEASKAVNGNLDDFSHTNNEAGNVP
jgi:hypothetical protein